MPCFFRWLWNGESNPANEKKVCSRSNLCVRWTSHVHDYNDLRVFCDWKTNTCSLGDFKTNIFSKYIYIYAYFVLFVKCWFELTFIYIFIIHSNYFQINGYFYCLHTFGGSISEVPKHKHKSWYTIISVEAYIISSYKRFQVCVRDEARRRCII